MVTSAASSRFTGPIPTARQRDAVSQETDWRFVVFGTVNVPRAGVTTTPWPALFWPTSIRPPPGAVATPFKDSVPSTPVTVVPPVVTTSPRYRGAGASPVGRPATTASPRLPLTWLA